MSDPNYYASASYVRAVEAATRKTRVELAKLRRVAAAFAAMENDEKSDAVEWCRKVAAKNAAYANDLADDGHDKPAAMIRRKAVGCSQVATELERLRAIVDLLPRSADGKAVVPNHLYWVRTGPQLIRRVLIVSIERTLNGWWCNDSYGEGYTPGEDLYDTREAAKRG